MEGLVYLHKDIPTDNGQQAIDHNRNFISNRHDLQCSKLLGPGDRTLTSKALWNQHFSLLSLWVKWASFWSRILMKSTLTWNQHVHNIKSCNAVEKQYQIMQGPDRTTQASWIKPSSPSHTNSSLSYASLHNSFNIYNSVNVLRYFHKVWWNQGQERWYT